CGLRALLAWSGPARTDPRLGRARSRGYNHAEIRKPTVRHPRVATMSSATPDPFGLTRRSLLRLGGSSIAAGMLGTSPELARAGEAPAPRRDRTIGIQVGAASFVDEGVDRVLDTLQER